MLGCYGTVKVIVRWGNTYSAWENMCCLYLAFVNVSDISSLGGGTHSAECRSGCYSYHSCVNDAFSK